MRLLGERTVYFCIFNDIFAVFAKKLTVAVIQLYRHHSCTIMQQSAKFHGHSFDRSVGRSVVRPSVRPSVNQSINQSINQPINQSPIKLFYRPRASVLCIDKYLQNTAAVTALRWDRNQNIIITITMLHLTAANSAVILRSLQSTVRSLLRPVKWDIKSAYSHYSRQQADELRRHSTLVHQCSSWHDHPQTGLYPPSLRYSLPSVSTRSHTSALWINHLNTITSSCKRSLPYDDWLRS